jgi:membrane-associated phospholipid phosphatase
MAANTSRILTVATGLVLLAGFVLLGILTGNRPTEPDREVETVLEGQWRHPVGAVADVVSVPLGPALPVVAGICLLIAALAAYRRNDRDLGRLLVRLLIVGALCRAVSAFKSVFDRQRPRIYPDLSYPSGHVTSVACTAFVAVLAVAWLARRFLPWVVAVSVAAVLLTAASRLVLGVHWLSDTVGAVLGVGGAGLLAATALGLLPVRRRS